MQRFGSGRVVNDAHDAVAVAAFGIRLGLQCGGIDADIGIQIDLAFANGIAQILEAKFPVLTRIDSHDISTPPPHQFIDAEVFKVAPIGEIDEIPVCVGPTQQLINEIREARKVEVA